MAEELVRRIYPAKDTIARLILAHGAGAGNQHEFMDNLAKELCELGIEVISFNFDYMTRQYREQKKRPPDRQPKLLERFQSELDRLDEQLPVFIAGKSMGGRMATLLPTSERVAGIIVYGYPFIPPGKPEKFEQRVVHFDNINKPVLILQGERDTFGNRALLEQKSFCDTITVEWIESGDHSFKPLKSSGKTSMDNIKTAAQLTVKRIKEILS